MIRTVLALASGYAALALLSCSSNGPGLVGGGCREYALPAGVDLNAPTASFKDHVMPIFRQSCGLSSSCHGSKQASKNDLYLGSSNDPDVSSVRAGILGKKAQDIDMKIVEPGDPKKSYLMRKMDGDQCALACNGGCKNAMPDGSDPIAEEKRLTVRRWITQGAKDN